MNILATNDDGYQCAGIQALAQAMRAAGHRVTVLAPDRERSCASHSMTLSGVSVRRIGEDVWICDGTPVDCVFAGISKGFGLNPDMVISGINAGSNLGVDVIFSGTVAAARQAALHRVPAAAFSLCGYHAPLYWESAARWAARNIAGLAALWTDDALVNVNIPNLEVLPEKAERTFLSSRRYVDDVIRHDPVVPNGFFRCEFTFCGLEGENQPGSDRDAVMRGRISASLVLLEQFAKPPPR